MRWAANKQPEWRLISGADLIWVCRMDFFSLRPWKAHLFKIIAPPFWHRMRWNFEGYGLLCFQLNRPLHLIFPSKARTFQKVGKTTLLVCNSCSIIWHLFSTSAVGWVIYLKPRWSLFPWLGTLKNIAWDIFLRFGHFSSQHVHTRHWKPKGNIEAFPTKLQPQSLKLPRTSRTKLLLVSNL